MSAASSLTEAFTALAADFEASHPGVDVALNFAGSSALVEQVNAGAPVDVLATASQQTMDAAVAAGSVDDPVRFARNELAVVVPADNEAGVSALADLARSDVVTAICAPDVPCGAATVELFANNGLDRHAVDARPRREVRALPRRRRRGGRGHRLRHRRTRGRDGRRHGADPWGHERVHRLSRRRRRGCGRSPPSPRSSSPS